MITIAGTTAIIMVVRPVHTSCFLTRGFHQEITGTIDDFREKGAWGALKDATLDAVDLVQDAGGPKKGLSSMVQDTLAITMTMTIYDYLNCCYNYCY